MGFLDWRRPASGRKSITSASSGASESDHGMSDEKTLESENAHLSPKEAFHKFDADSSGDIDEDEFFHLLQSVGIEGNEEYQERLFRRYLKSGSKTIDYDGFKAAWLLLGNPKQELIDRGVKDLPKFATRHQLVRLLEKTLGEEERVESLAKAEADRYQRLRDRRSHRTEHVERAGARAGLELGAALDAAGQVYVLGTGAHGQFGGAPKKDMSTSSFRQVGFDLVQRLWTERVAGEGVANSNTAGVWGRRPRKCVLTDNAILALTDNGILSWGGTSSWHELLDDPPRLKTQTTPRSAALLMNDETMHKKHLAIIREERSDRDAKAASEIKLMETALRYYGSWPFHFDGTDDVDMVRDHLMTNVSHDQLLHSLLLRGKPCEGNGLSKVEMAEMLAEDITLEKEVLGERGQQELCDMENEIIDLNKRKKAKPANSIRLKFSEIWLPLQALTKQRALSEERREEEERRDNTIRQDSEYEKWNSRRLQSERENVLDGRGLMAGSITFRGSDVRTPRGTEQTIDIAAGSNHAAIIVRLGSVRDETSCGNLYTWGSNSLGRLGQGNSELIGDTNYPTLVEELKGISMASISMGQSHSAAISSKGTLYCWGAGSSGQLGFGEISNSSGGYYCPIPTRLKTRVVKVSCGHAHTACIGTSADLYVWGLGDGGRLGLGRDRMATHHTPELVESLRHERISDVSCGCSTTMALTKIEAAGANSRTSVKRITGGRLYVAGPKNVLGDQYLSFGEIRTGFVIKSIGAGYSHQSFVSESGELYCWGHNLRGCCGQNERTKFVPEPTKVSWLCEAPKNLALGKQCRLSTLYKDSNGLSASNAVDGNIFRNLAYTQFEPSPYFEVDLGEFVQITSVRLWNRTDEPDDCALNVNTYSKRLFPCVVMISQFPFSNDDSEGKRGLETCLSQSIAKVRFSEDKRMSKWDVPKFTIGRYVRLQLEGTNFLHFAQIEVFGHAFRPCSPGSAFWHERPCSSIPITSCSAGKFVTAAVVSGLDAKGIEAAYKRAVSADWYNAEILRQLRSYADCYRKEGNSTDSKAECLLCIGDLKCEICSLKSEYGTELQAILNGDERYRLGDLATHLLSESTFDLDENGGSGTGKATRGESKLGSKRNLFRKKATEK